jgi:8-oxo-dGTP pyrophosphatase MutT (NUDIX family)
MDKPNENPADTIKRELLEETGYTFEGKPELLLEGPFNAGLLADEMMVFYASGAWKEREPNLEPTEDIEVITVLAGSLVDFVLNPPRGCLPDVKLLSVLPILERRGVI